MSHSSNQRNKEFFLALLVFLSLLPFYSFAQTCTGGLSGSNLQDCTGTDSSPCHSCNVSDMDFEIRAPDDVTTTGWRDMSYFTEIGTCSTNCTEETWTNTYYWWCPQEGFYDMRIRAYALDGGTTYGWETSAWDINKYYCLSPPTYVNSTASTQPLNSNQGKVTITWTDYSADESGYKVERSTDNLRWTQIGTVGANITTYTDSSLEDNTRYYYRVKAYGSGWESNPSSVKSVVTRDRFGPNEPELTATADNANNEVDLSWDWAQDEDLQEETLNVSGTTAGTRSVKVVAGTDPYFYESWDSTSYNGLRYSNWEDYLAVGGKGCRIYVTNASYNDRYELAWFCYNGAGYYGSNSYEAFEEDEDHIVYRRLIESTNGLTSNVPTNCPNDYEGSCAEGLANNCDCDGNQYAYTGTVRYTGDLVDYLYSYIEVEKNRGSVKKWYDLHCVANITGGYMRPAVLYNNAYYIWMPGYFAGDKNSTARTATIEKLNENFVAMWNNVASGEQSNVQIIYWDEGWKPYQVSFYAYSGIFWYWSRVNCSSGETIPVVPVYITQRTINSFDPTDSDSDNVPDQVERIVRTLVKNHSLTATYHFDEDSNPITLDATGNGNDGTFGLTKQDSFDSKDTSFWTFDNSYQMVPYKLSGNNVLKMWGANAWKGFYQSTADITTGEEVYFEFMRTGSSSWHMGALETSDGSKRWCIQESSGNIRVQYNDGSGWVYPKTLITGAKTGVWYSAVLRVDDSSGFYIKVWEKENPSVYGDYTYAMPTGLSWRFHAWQYQNVPGYIDNFKIRNFSSDPSRSESGRFGKALSFDGTDDYVSIPSVNPTEEISVEAWVKSNTDTGYSGVWQIVSKYNAFILGTSSTGGKEMCFIIYNGSAWQYGSCYTVPDPQNWHHFVGTYDSSTGEKKLYVDGVLRGTANVSGTINPDTGPIHIAHRESASIGSYHFGGLIDEVRIYNRALTESEIQSRAKYGLYRSPTQSGTYEPAGGLWDDFEDGDDSGWTHGDGTWSVGSAGGRTYVLKQTDTTSATRESIIGQSSWTDYIVETEIYAPSAGDSTNHPGIVFRATDTGNYHVCYFRPHSSGTGSAVACRKTVDGSLQSETSGTATIPWDKWFRAKIVVTGTTAKVYINGVYSVTYTVDTASGKAGLFEHDSVGYFDNFKVTPLLSDNSYSDSDASDQSAPNTPGAPSVSAVSPSQLDVSWSSVSDNGDDWYFYAKAFDDSGNESNLFNGRGWTFEGGTNEDGFWFYTQAKSHGEITSAEKFTGTYSAHWWREVDVNCPTNHTCWGGIRYGSGGGDTSAGSRLGLEENHSYRLSFKYKGNITSDSSASVYMCYTMGWCSYGQGYPRLSIGSFNPDTNSEWREFSAVFTVPTGFFTDCNGETCARELALAQFDYVSVLAEEHIYIDDVRLEEVKSATVTTDVNGYFVDETTANSGASDYGWGTSTSYSDTGLSANTQYCYKVKARDNALNESSYGTQTCRYTLPEDPVPVSSSHTVNECSNDTTVDFTCSGVASGYYYVWNQASNTTVSSSDTAWDGSQITKTATSDGSWYLHVIAVNSEGAYNSSGTVHLGPFKIDTQAPTTSDDANTQWQGSDQTITLTPSDGSGCGVANTYYCIDTDNTCSPSTSGTTVNVSCASGSVCQQYVRYYSVDVVGNTETVNSVLIRIDKEPPTTSTDANTEWQSTDQTVNFLINDSSGAGGDSAYYCIDDSNSCTPSTLDSSATVTCAANSVCQKYLRYKGVDYVGNEDQIRTVLIKIDKQAPTTSSDANTEWVNSDQTITLSPSDGSGSGIADTYYCVDESNTCSPSTSGTTVNVSCASGSVCQQYVRYYSKDNVGNNESIQSQLIKIDKQLPSTSDDSNSVWQKTNVIVTLSPSDGSGSGIANTYYCIDESGTCTPTTSGTTVSVTCATGSICQKYVRYYSTDNAGNQESIKTSNLIKIDKQLPVTTDDAPTAWQNSDVNITLTPSDGSGSGVANTYYCYDDSNSCTPNISGTSITIQCPSDSVCQKYLRYYSTDVAGNNEGVNVALVRIDKQAPTTTDNAPSDWVNHDVNVTLSPSDGSGSGIATTYYCVDDSNSCSPSSSGTIATVTCDVNSVCQQYVRYYSIDNVSNQESVNWALVKIDKNGPYTSHNITEEWYADDVNVELTCSSASDSCVETTYRVNGGSWTVYSSPFTVSESGINTVDYNSRDSLGNIEPIRTAYVRIDRTAPSTTNDANTFWQNADLSFNLLPSDSQSGVAASYYCIDTSNTCSPSSSGTSVTVTCPDNQHCRKYVRYYSVDNVGNQESVKSVFTRVDKRKPLTLAEWPQGWQNVDFNVALTCTDENGSGRYIIKYRFDSEQWVSSLPLDALADLNWWDLNWARRRKITFDNSGQAEKNNYSILLRLNSSNFIFMDVQSQGQDIRFIDSDNSTQLEYFFDEFDYSQQDALIWVKVPKIDAGSTTDHIWMYYSNSNATDAQSANWFD